MTTLTQTSLETPLELFYQRESNISHITYLSQPIAGKWHTWTWGETADEIRRMVTALQSRGIAPGAKIGLLSRNCAHWIMADIAIMIAGYVSVPIYPNVKRDTVSYILDHAECELLFVGKLLQSDWDEMKHGVPADMPCISFGMYGLKDAEYSTWQEEIAANEPSLASPTRSLDDTMTIIYTSGTTGTPKGVVHTFMSPRFAIETFFGIFELNENDRFFSYLPLSHIAERMLILMGSLRSGGSIHFAESLDTFADNLKTCSPTVFLGVPRIWTKFQKGVLAKFSQGKLNILFAIPFVGNLIKGKIKEALGLSQARVCLTGAAPTPVSLLNWWQRVGLTIHEVYGMTENSAYSHANIPGKMKFGTAGVAMAEVDVKITDEGEICVKSPANMVEYYKEPQKTADALRDGYLHTGDKGEIDSQGFLKITGRVKDLFKTSKAKYVAPSPIEMLLSKNDYIEQVCVVGDGIPQPLALVVLSEEGRKLGKSDIKDSLQETLDIVNPKLDHHEKLKAIVVMSEEWTVENGVLTPSLKIKRGEIDNRFQTMYPSWYEAGEAIQWK
ncbi:AMP-binding protein [Pontibacter sp. G13]|uniref:AMP-binding protein n=1 Tax=Pontibacter sp. G13 TaxID=3074898 RepID=UPI00288A4D3F|nr:AMP-binding protein [Pontibacter sp. G13]WNJ16789.1 AMP-binding protein [Pontibacter sp. G13]